MLEGLRVGLWAEIAMCSFTVTERQLRGLLSNTAIIRLHKTVLLNSVWFTSALYLCLCLRRNVHQT